MRRALHLALLIATLSALCLGGGFYLGRKRTKSGPIAQNDTITLRETITVQKPVYVRERVRDTIKVMVTDTLRTRDTLWLALPRMERVYSDSLYRAVVSGYEPSLDTMEVVSTTRTVFVPVVKKVEPRWSLGVQTGVGLTGADGLKASPYIGVGVSWNILSW